MNNFYCITMILILIIQTIVMVIHYERNEHYLSVIAHHLIELKKKLTLGQKLGKTRDK
jgi:hypothetical protein